jgi:signal transduction histidine kinase
MVAQDSKDILSVGLVAELSNLRSIAMLTSSVNYDPPAEANDICASVESLSTLISNIQSLEANNQRLTLAMTTAGHDLRRRLHVLLSTIELLTVTAERSRRIELNQRAKSLIFSLAAELEQLAVQAQCEHSRAVPAVYSFVISSLLGQLKSDWECEAAAKGLHFSVADANYPVQSDQRLLAVIMNNLVSNAVRHTVRGSVTVCGTIEGQFLVLSVEDTGPGISHEDIRRSFGFSARLRGFEKGMGLGLSIARKTAAMLGHEFIVATDASGGTRIRLCVPVAKCCESDAPSAKPSDA